MLTNSHLSENLSNADALISKIAQPRIKTLSDTVVLKPTLAPVPVIKPLGTETIAKTPTVVIGSKSVIGTPLFGGGGGGGGGSEPELSAKKEEAKLPFFKTTKGQITAGAGILFLLAIGVYAFKNK